MRALGQQWMKEDLACLSCLLTYSPTAAPTSYHPLRVIDVGVRPRREVLQHRLAVSVVGSHYMTALRLAFCHLTYIRYNAMAPLTL